MRWLELITLLALIEYLAMGLMVGRARDLYKVAAPATTGDPTFERYYRVHHNTLEALIIFIPALWLFALLANRPLAIVLGAIFIIVRAWYARSYIADPASRAPGAIATFAINAILLLGALVGLIVHAL
jgi:glutathione S-transferase